MKAISEESTEWYWPSNEAHPHALHRVAGEHARFHRLAHAFLDRRDERAGDHAALDLVDELVAVVAVGVVQRLDLDLAVAELAAPAGLLLVAAVGAGALARIVSR